MERVTQVGDILTSNGKQYAIVKKITIEVQFFNKDGLIEGEYVPIDPKEFERIPNVNGNKVSMIEVKN